MSDPPPAFVEHSVLLGAHAARLAMRAPDRTAEEEVRWRRLAAIVTSGQRCRWCRRYGTPRNPICAHHLFPRSAGGPDELANLVPVCRRCHPRAEAESRRLVMASLPEVVRARRRKARERARAWMLERALDRAKNASRP